MFCKRGFRCSKLLVPFLLHSSTQRTFVSSFFTNTMAPFVTQRENGIITISPKNEAEQSGLVVISHGLGDTAEGFVDVAEVRNVLRQ